MSQIQVQHQAALVQSPNAVRTVSPGPVQMVPISLYVGDLDLAVSDAQLFDLFNQIGQVVSVRVCRDIGSHRSLGYGYVNFGNPEDANRALEILNFTPLNNKPIRIMYSVRDPTTRKSGAGNIFIKNLDKGIDHKALHDTFSAFGNILSCKVVTDSLGQSKGHGFVQFENEESAQAAIDKLNGMLMNDKQVYVGHFLRKHEREVAIGKVKFNNVYVKNLTETATEDDLNRIFGEHGKITSAVVMRDADGKSKCFGFVNFENPDDAAKAVEALNGRKVDEKEWYVGKAQKKSERELELRGRFERAMKETVDKHQGLNLYIKNLDDSINDEKLKELFSEFGTITSCKVMCDPSGFSKGSGFVAFSCADQASKALAEMNGKMVVSKPLYVAFAQRKEDRRARLQAHFSQMRPIAMSPPVGARMPMYPPGAGMGQQFIYGPAGPGIMAPQAGFGYQQPMVPGIRAGGGPMGNFFVPMMQGQRPAGRRGVQPVMQQSMVRGRMNRYPRGMGEVGMVPAPAAAYEMSMREPPMAIAALASALPNVTPEQQRSMLGESLYPLVEHLEPGSAAKITGMLLEMDQHEVLHLLESPEALKAKVAEAMDVLKSVAAHQGTNSSPADHLASLSLNE